MRKHGFTRADLGAWQAKYGMPYIYKEPSAARIAALSEWRKESTALKAWKRFRKAAEAAEDHPEIPALDAKTDSFDNFSLRAWGESRVLIVCEKNGTATALEGWCEKVPSFAYAHRAAIATTYWLPLRRSVEALSAYARQAQAPIAWFGDLDPQAIHSFATLRAGGRDELFASAKKKLRIAYCGLDSAWLDPIDRTERGRTWMTIEMRHVDREYWRLVQRLVPDARALIGRQASELLDSGKKIEVDGLVGQYRETFFRELGRRVAHI